MKLRNWLALNGVVPVVALLAFNATAKADDVQLSSLDLSNIQQATGRPQADKSADGHAITIGGKKFDHGIGMQAPGKIILDLEGGTDHFSAMVGVDDEVTGGAATLTITGDSRRLWPPQAQGRNSGGGRGRGQIPSLPAGAAQKIDLDVKGIRVLVVDVGSSGNGPKGHVDLADAVLSVSGTKPTIAAIPEDKPTILTPAAPATPRINGAKIFGVRPGHPFMFTVAATGDRPMQFQADHLPDGLKMDPATGLITGATATAGEYLVTLHAKNSLGTNDRELKIVVGDLIDLTPQMGWNSWNCFAGNVDQGKVKAAADSMVKSGLINHGWSYINTDDFWEFHPGSTDPTLTGDARNADGIINPNKRFPDMKGMADYIHSLGLKAGLYSSPGPTTCGGCIASYQHEAQDVQTWANWGFDYIKYDWCSYGNIVRAEPDTRDRAMKPYKLLGDELAKANRDIIFSLCQYGNQNVWEWGDQVNGNSWRTTGDITDNWQSMSSIGFGQAGHEKFAKPGHWNDPDMLVVGKVGWGPRLRPTGLTPNEQYTHISLWSLLCSPLLIGCDMTQMDDFTKNLLTNDEVLEVSQDPAGHQAGRIAKIGEFEVWAKDMSDGSKAVGLFNRSELPGTISAKWSDLGITGKQTVRNIWTQTDIGDFDTQFETSVPRHGVVLIKFDR